MLSAEVEIELHSLSLSSILLQPGMAVWWSSEPLLRCDRADSSLLVILVRIETFSHESAAIETAHRLPHHVCTSRALWLLSAEVEIELHSLSLFHSSTAWDGCAVA